MPWSDALKTTFFTALLRSSPFHSALFASHYWPIPHIVKWMPLCMHANAFKALGRLLLVIGQLDGVSF